MAKLCVLHSHFHLPKCIGIHTPLFFSLQISQLVVEEKQGLDRDLTLVSWPARVKGSGLFQRFTMSSPPSSVSHPFLTAKWGVEEAEMLYFSFSVALRWEIEIIKQTPRKKTRCWENEPSNYKQTSKCSLRGRYYYKGTEQSWAVLLGPGWVQSWGSLSWCQVTVPGPLGGQAQVWENRIRVRGCCGLDRGKKTQYSRFPSCPVLIWRCRGWVGALLECRWGTSIPSCPRAPPPFLFPHWQPPPASQHLDPLPLLPRPLPGPSHGLPPSLGLRHKYPQTWACSCLRQAREKVGLARASAISLRPAARDADLRHALPRSRKIRDGENRLQYTHGGAKRRGAARRGGPCKPHGPSSDLDRQGSSTHCTPDCLLGSVRRGGRGLRWGRGKWQRTKWKLPHLRCWTGLPVAPVPSSRAAFRLQCLTLFNIPVSCTTFRRIQLLWYISKREFEENPWDPTSHSPGEHVRGWVQWEPRYSVSSSRDAPSIHGEGADTQGEQGQDI